MKSFLSRPYAEYDGLFCEFHGSMLADLPAEARALAWPMLRDSPEYAQLAVGWLQDSLPEPRNLAAEEMLDQSVQQLTAENAALSSRLAAVEEKNAFLVSDWNRIRQHNVQLVDHNSSLNSMMGDLEAHIAERNNRIQEITGSQAYRIGRLITAPYRVLRRACRAVR